MADGKSFREARWNLEHINKCACECQPVEGINLHAESCWCKRMRSIGRMLGGWEGSLNLFIIKSMHSWSTDSQQTARAAWRSKRERENSTKPPARGENVTDARIGILSPRGKLILPSLPMSVPCLLVRHYILPYVLGVSIFQHDLQQHEIGQMSLRFALPWALQQTTKRPCETGAMRFDGCDCRIILIPLPVNEHSVRLYSSRAPLLRMVCKFSGCISSKLPRCKAGR